MLVYFVPLVGPVLMEEWTNLVAFVWAVGIVLLGNIPENLPTIFALQDSIAHLEVLNLNIALLVHINQILEPSSVYLAHREHTVIDGTDL